MKNRINDLFERKGKEILNIYYTAGFPQPHDTLAVAKALDVAAADMIEIGIPYSDPVADGPTIQRSNNRALKGGISLKKLFNQLEELRPTVKLPVILMGYFNVVLHYGIEKFCADCARVGIDGVILPDLPLDIYEQEYRNIFEKYGIKNIYLITPQTSPQRIRMIDDLSDSFIYMVSSASITGAKSGISDEQVDYFRRIGSMNLKNPTLIGFGISDHDTFTTACNYANGAIIGSRFVNFLDENGADTAKIASFVKEIRG